jgi:KaiC/GvpD/RAD55 family RecA-like ATPase
MSSTEIMVNVPTIMSYFRGREGHCGVQVPGSTFRRLDKTITDDMFQDQHLTGKACYGFYLMSEKDTVYCSCVDFDNHEDQPDPDWDLKAERVYHFLQERDMEPVYEVSSSGSGAHVWLFFETPLPAWLVRRFWTAVAKQLKLHFPEVYPRQDYIREGGYGNLVRLPYWNNSHFVDPEMGGRIEFPVPRFTTRAELEDLCIAVGVSILPETSPDSELPIQVKEILETPNSLLARRWRGDFSGLSESSDQSRSAQVFYLAQELVYQRIPTADVVTALQCWCDENDYEKGENDQWLELVVQRAYDSVRSRLHTMEEAGDTIVDCAETFLGRFGKDHYFSSGISSIDSSIDGIAPGEVGIIAARPGHGKSALALQWLIHQADLGVNCLMLNAEMSAYEIGRRLIMHSFPNESDWNDNRSDMLDWIKSQWSSKGKLYYRPVGTIEDVENHIHNYVQKRGVQIVAVDYLQLLRSSTTNGRYETVTEISQRIKGAARDNDVAILALCQVSREVERRENISFQGSDLRESGQLEQDADLIMFAWYYGRGGTDTADPDRYDLFLAKRRNGPIRNERVSLTFNSQRQWFHDGA